MRSLLSALACVVVATAASTAANAKSCEQLRSLCYTMRDDKNDCARPYQRCLSTGVFVTPLGRVFKATK